MNWMLEILVTHRRMKGLTANQILELIDKAEDIESLRIIKEHLEKMDFKFPHIEAMAIEMSQKCIDKAKEILWRQQVDKVRQIFMDTVDPFGS